MAVQLNPKDAAHLMTRMVYQTQLHRFVPDGRAVYAVLQGPKQWMNTFIYANNKRPKLFLQYGDDPSKPSIALYFSNSTPDGTFPKEFLLHLHRFNPGGILRADGSWSDPKPGAKLMTFAFRAPDTTIDPYSNKEVHLKGADTDLAKDILSTMEPRT